MEMARVWPIIFQNGVGAVLLGVGIWAGLASRYMDLSLREDRRLLWTFIGGYILLIVFASVFTFWLPLIPAEAMP